MTINQREFTLQYVSKKKMALKLMQIVKFQLNVLFGNMTSE